MSRTFLIASLVAAGFGTRDPLAADVLKATTASDDRGNGTTLFETFRQDHSITLADHRSHRSHSSHSSHRSSGGGHYSHSSHTSHRSSTGGGGTYNPAPAPVYSPPSSSGSSGDSSGSTYQDSTPSKLYGSPDTSAARSEPLKPLPGRSELFKTIVKRVQIALLAHGVFSGSIDGDVGPATRKALRAYQGKYGLKQTGTITPETLDSLKVSSSP